jgi:hypothetical protein
MTPQPQPAAYWIELLEELTGGIPYRINENKWDVMYPSLFDFVEITLSVHCGLDRDFEEALIEDAHYLTSGQNVIDAAVEYNFKLREAGIAIRYAFNLYDQTELYLRCNGVKR